ncbi:GNAT family N-acetyltransferase [Methylogaea oryzae]|uniref:GNAT family N-acetyltransferase n=1 Tax=Methylogaea oryzae TaxID=1295382 RepID=UPI0020D1C026|nr:GNAT family N-acetyltransferase [Methylogaea oryzae]
MRAAQKLRYRVFVEEMGAVIHTPHYGLDWDEIDDHCDHLIVIDNQTGAIVGTTRLLNDRQAKRLGRYYSEGEFGLEGVLGLEGRFLEIGRTCVDRNVRGGAVLTCLWGVLADYAAAGGYDYLMAAPASRPAPAASPWKRSTNSSPPNNWDPPASTCSRGYRCLRTCAASGTNAASRRC